MPLGGDLSIQTLVWHAVVVVVVSLIASLTGPRVLSWHT
jgi:hypothetical protein